MLRLFFLLLPVCWFGPVLLAYAQDQTGGHVRGQVVEAASNAPTEFATVALYALPDSALVTGGVTDGEGRFRVALSRPGNYYLQVSLLGYRLQRQSFRFEGGRSELELGRLRLEADDQLLEDVVISGEREPIEFQLGKRVVNVDQNLVSAGGSAVDALQNIPSVQVDENGGVSLRGSENVTIFINGKQSGLTRRGAEALEQLPASAIERIEIITNPSSRYDAAGTAGIINIILKKDQRQGLYGNAQATVGTNNKYNTSVNLNYGLGKLSFNGGYDFRYDDRFGDFRSDRRTFFPDSVVTLNQRNDNKRIRENHVFRLGADYRLGRRQSFSVGALLRTDDGTRPTDIFYDQLTVPTDGSPAFGRRFRRTADNAQDEYTVDLNVGYVLTFAQPGRELAISALHNRNVEDEQETFFERDIRADQTDIAGTGFRQRSRTDANGRQTIAQADYVHPLGEKRRFELGSKYLHDQNDNDFRFESFDETTQSWVNNPNLSNRFVFDQHVYAGYASFGDERGTISYQAGLRAEQTFVTADQRTTSERFDNQFFNLFPSLTLARKFDPQRSLQLSYGRRIERPRSRQLNPFLNLTDPRNTRQGNPTLLPELIHSFELGYLQTWKNLTLSPTIFVRYNDNLIQYVRQLQPDGTTNTTFLNVGQATAYGLEVIGSGSLYKWWKADGSLTYFRREIAGTLPDVGGIRNANFNWTAKLNSNFTVTRKLSLQWTLNYTSPGVTLQGTRRYFLFTDLAGRYEVLDRRGFVTFRLSDILNTLEFGFEAEGPGFETQNRFKRETRVAFLGFTYRFGQAPRGPQPRRRAPERRGGDMEDFG